MLVSLTKEGDKVTEVKWIKLYVDMVSNKKIKRIRKLPSGNDVILIWVFLLAQAGESNKEGGLFLTNAMPFTPEDLSFEFDFPIDVINFALITLEKFEMIEIFEDIIYIKNWNEYQNINGLDKIREQTKQRVARHRKKLINNSICQYCGNPATGFDHIVAIARGGKDVKENKVPCCIECNRIKNDKPIVDFLNNNRDRINDELIGKNENLKKFVTLCNVTDRYNVTQCNATEREREEEREIDKEEDKEREKDKEENKENLSLQSLEICKSIESITCGKWYLVKDTEKLNALIKMYTYDWTKDAVNQAAVKGKYNITYAEGILRNWSSEGREENKQNARYANNNADNKQDKVEYDFNKPYTGPSHEGEEIDF